MKNRIIAVLLVISLAGCSTFPRFAPWQPSSSTEAAVLPSVSTVETPLPEERVEEQAARKDVEDAAKQTDTTRGKADPGVQVGVVILAVVIVVAFYALLGAAMGAGVRSTW